jgi:hypothetical protein
VSEVVNITVPAKAFRAAIVLDDECQECGRSLGDEFHRCQGKTLCKLCFGGKVQQLGVIDTDSYRELPPE